MLFSTDYRVIQSLHSGVGENLERSKSELGEVMIGNSSVGIVGTCRQHRGFQIRQCSAGWRSA